MREPRNKRANQPTNKCSITIPPGGDNKKWHVNYVIILVKTVSKLQRLCKRSVGACIRLFRAKLGFGLMTGQAVVKYAHRTYTKHGQSLYLSCKFVHRLFSLLSNFSSPYQRHFLWDRVCIQGGCACPPLEVEIFVLIFIVKNYAKI